MKTAANYTHAIPLFKKHTKIHYKRELQELREHEKSEA